MSVFVDGVLVDTATSSENVTTSYSFNVGQGVSGQNQLDGDLCDIAFFRRGFSDDEIAAVWNGGAGARIIPA